MAVSVLESAAAGLGSWRALLSAGAGLGVKDLGLLVGSSRSVRTVTVPSVSKHTAALATGPACEHGGNNADWVPLQGNGS